MSFWNSKKPTPSKEEVVTLVLRHIAQCGCEASSHTLKAKVLNYTVTIIVTSDEDERKS